MHGHVKTEVLAEDAPFPGPARLLVVPDHYVTRMLVSQGVPLEALGVPRRDGVLGEPGTPETPFGSGIFRQGSLPLHLGHVLVHRDTPRP